MGKITFDDTSHLGWPTSLTDIQGGSLDTGRYLVYCSLKIVS